MCVKSRPPLEDIGFRYDFETMIEFLKHDCMWSGNCDRKCQGKMESFLSKSPYSNDLNEIYFNLCGGQMLTNGHDSIDLLDSLDGEDFNLNDLMNGFSSNQNHQLNNCQQQTGNNQFTSYYQCQPQQTNYVCQQPSVKSSTNFNTISLVNINQIQQQPQNNQQSPIQTSTNQSVVATKPFVDSSSLLNSSLNNNDLLLNSNSANIILTQHNQQVDNSQLPNQNSNQINYNQTSLNTNLNNLNNQDLVNCTNETASIGASIHSTTSNLNSLNTHQTNTHTSFSNYQNMINYGFDNSFTDSTFCSPCHVTDSAGSSSNSECSSSVLLERTDYDTDDIEDDLDLLEDIIEEECDDDPNISIFTRSNCHSIANSLESCSDVEMVASPISDSLINDHSYGASSIEVLTNQPVSNALTTNTTITNVQSSYANQPNSTATRTLINHHRNHQTELKSSKLTNKRKSLSNLNDTSSHQSNSKKNLQRHSGTSLLMKEKQSKIKKVMDTDRRKEHNESERMRRDVLKNAFLTLRSRCPKLQSSSKKSSRIQILNEATLHIKEINKHFKQKDVEMQKEAEINRRLRARYHALKKAYPHLID